MTPTSNAPSAGRHPLSLDSHLLDRRGARRSPVTLPEHRRGRPARNRGMRLPPEPLTQAEALRLLAACEYGRPSASHPEGHPCHAARRNRALIVVMWRSGLRVGEALALKPGDVDVERGTIRVLHGKGDRSRVVGLDPGAAMLVHEWLLERLELGFSGAVPLFCVLAGASRGQRVASPYVRELLKRLAVKAGVHKRVHPHGLRHTNACELGEEGVPVHYIRRHLGHSSLRVTALYMDKLRPAEVIERIRAREWPGELPGAA